MEESTFKALLELFSTRRYTEVRKLLDTSHQFIAEADQMAIRGLSYYLAGNFAESIIWFEQALSIKTETNWADLLAKARLNDQAGLADFVPEISYFQIDQLLAAPEQYPGKTALIVPVSESKNIYKSLSIFIGNLLGWVASHTINGITKLAGSIWGYKDEIWTNWYRRPQLLAILTLANMREKLNRHNLKSTYAQNTLIGFHNQNLEDPPQRVKLFRTADGSWNNLNNPKEGAAGTRFMRNINPDAVKRPGLEDILSPNPREISLSLLSRRGKMLEVPFLNLLAAAWIQFQNHDWISHGEVLMHDLYEIPLHENDPARKKYWQKKLFVGKTQPDLTHRTNDPFSLTFINEVTHWWDASQLYGSDDLTQNKLRSFQQGKLKLDDRGLLPRDHQGMEITGYVRNWWVGLSLFHTLFCREHNAICDMLRNKYPHLQDEQLFQTARLINAALLAKIHSLEWNSAINPNPVIQKGNRSNWYGLWTVLRKNSKDWKTVEEINIRNTELGGVVGNPIDKHESPFGLTQEFVEVYRLHSMLPEELVINTLDAKHPKNIPFSLSRQKGSGICLDEFGLPDLFHSFGNQHPGQLVLNNYPRFMQELTIPGNPVYDMGAVDILRARERGVPKYNEFRRQLGLNPIRSFQDLNSDPGIMQKLHNIYQGDVEKLDLMIGTLGEVKRPTHFAFGETMFQIFLLNATRRLQADRFYTDCYTSYYYTPEGMNWIDQNNLKSVLLRHFPELAQTGLRNIDNAFEPWDEGPELTPQRHPLAYY